MGNSPTFSGMREREIELQFARRQIRNEWSESDYIAYTASLETTIAVSEYIVDALKNGLIWRREYQLMTDMER
jgi:hypothetical protein